MKRIREIEISDVAPASDKIWLKPSEEGYGLYVMLNGAWNKIASSESAGISDEDMALINQKIEQVASKADSIVDKIDTVLKDAPEALDTFKEVSDKAAELETKIESINDAMEELDLDAEKVTLASDNSNLTSALNVKAALEKIANKVWYSKIAINSFTANPAFGTYEYGTSVTNPTVTWTTSKVPAKVTLTDATISDPTVKTYTYSKTYTATKTLTLGVTESDAEAGTASKTGTWTIAYAVYTNTVTDPGTYTQDWAKNTVGGKTLKTSAAGTYTMKGSTTNQYWFLVAPKVWTLKFSTQLGDGGATKVGEIAGFVNDKGQTVPMAVYRAEKVQGSDYKITVS